MKWESKGFTSIEEVIQSNTGFSVEKLNNFSREPFLAGLEDCVRVVKRCIQQNMNITIVGDYDADGITSSTILELGLEEIIGYRPKVRLPKRFSEGYGLSDKIIDEIADGLIITVDNGIAAAEAVSKAKEKGLTVVVIDHHVKRDDGKIPDADAICDPHVITGSEYDGYCGAGLAYRFILSLNPDTRIREKLIAFAGIGTVCDVMPLIGDNRRLVLESLKSIMQGTITWGLKILLETMQIETSHITETDYGFQLGPCFNASGRLYDDGAERVQRLVSEDGDPFELFYREQEIRDEALSLVETNEERKQLVFDTMEIVSQMIADIDTQKPIILYNPDFHEGIVGILAGKLSEQYKVPAIVLTDSGKEGIIKGSGRSVPEVHLKKVLDKTNCLLGYGGHAGAAGLSLEKKNLDLLRMQIFEILSDFQPSDVNTIYYDIDIKESDVPHFADALRDYAPYGEECPKIRFRINNIIAVPKAGSHYVVMGPQMNHIKITGSNNLTLLAFNMKDRYEEDGFPSHIDVIGELGINYYNGLKGYQIEIIDYKKSVKNETLDYKNLKSLLCFI